MDGIVGNAGSRAGRAWPWLTGYDAAGAGETMLHDLARDACRCRWC